MFVTEFNPEFVTVLIGLTVYHLNHLKLETYLKHILLLWHRSHHKEKTVGLKLDRNIGILIIRETRSDVDIPWIDWFIGKTCRRKRYTRICFIFLAPSLRISHQLIGEETVWSLTLSVRLWWKKREKRGELIESTCWGFISNAQVSARDLKTSSIPRGTFNVIFDTFANN